MERSLLLLSLLALQIALARLDGSCPEPTIQQELDIRGNLAESTQSEDTIALNIFNKWLESTGSSKMQCDDLRVMALVFADAPVSWDELTEGAAELAQKESKWPTACEEDLSVEDCRKRLAKLTNVDEILEGFKKINDFVDELREGQKEFGIGIETQDCKSVLFKFIDQALKFRTNIQKTITCMPEMPRCPYVDNKIASIKAMAVYQNQKGRAMTKMSKQEAAAKLGDQKDLPHMTRNGGVSMETKNTLPELRDFFDKPFIHGKLLMQRNVSRHVSNPALLYELAGAPFVGGASGSVLEIMKLADAYSGKKFNLNGRNVEHKPVDDKMALLFMALLDLGGHHSLTEVALSVKEWGLLKDIKMPFRAHTRMRVGRCRYGKFFRRRYGQFLSSLRDHVNNIYP